MKVTDTLKLFVAAIAAFFRRTLLGRAMVFLSLPLFILLVALWKPDRVPPIFDAQVHYNEESWEDIPVKAILNTAEEKNVPWLLVGSLPNEGTWLLYDGNPSQVIPMLVPYQSSDERDTWFADPKSLSYIEKEISAKPYRGIGEFFLFDGQVNTPVVRGMVEIALKHGLVLHARSDQFAIDQLFALGPELRILWAHGGMFTEPKAIGEMLARYPRLWVEISQRGDVAPGGKLSPEWLDVMQRYPDRFLLGSGTYTKDYWYQFRYAFDRYRGWLKQLPPDVAEQIAFRNGLKLFRLSYQEANSSGNATSR